KLRCRSTIEPLAVAAPGCTAHNDAIDAVAVHVPGRDGDAPAKAGKGEEARQLRWRSPIERLDVGGAGGRAGQEVDRRRHPSAFELFEPGPKRPAGPRALSPRASRKPLNKRRIVTHGNSCLDGPGRQTRAALRPDCRCGRTRAKPR